jgi:hypothetical protein
MRVNIKLPQKLVVFMKGGKLAIDGAEGLDFFNKLHFPGQRRRTIMIPWIVIKRVQRLVCETSSFGYFNEQEVAL